MVRVYGESDDLVIIDGTKTEYDEIACYGFEEVCHIEFDDETKIAVSYPKKVDGVEIGVWAIFVKKQGTAQQKLEECFDEEADCYSDVFEIDSEIKDVKVV